MNGQCLTQSPAHTGAGRLHGVITVWMALTLSVFLAVTGVLLDFARAQCVSYRLAAAASSACESVFAGYSRALLGRYHLLARNIDSEETLQEETAGYLSPRRKGHRRYGDLTAFRIDSADWSECVYMTDENGAVFRKMASDAMTDGAGGILVSSWKERLGLNRSDTAKAAEESAGKDSFHVSDVLQDYDEVMEAEEEPEAPGDGTAGGGGTEEPEASGDGTAGDAADAEDGGKEEPPEISGQGRKILERLENLKGALSRGLMGLLVPEGKTISAASVPSGGLPSSLSAGAKGRHVRASGGSGNPILFREYLMRNMTCFTTEGTGRPAYEIEYLIAGKNSDDRNLQSVLIRLFFLRVSCNTMTIMKTPAMHKAVGDAAVLCMGWTGSVTLTAGMTGLLAAAWAAAESISDIRSLLADGRIPLLKTAGQWRLGFAGFDSVLKESTGVQDETDGLSYGDHLRILLYFAPDRVLSYRGMDVIDWNVRKLHAGFSCSRCMVEGRLTVEGGGRFLFPHLYRHMAGSRGYAGFTKSAAFSLLAN